MSQYDTQLRSILGLDIHHGGTDFNTTDTNSIMLSILGGREPDSHLAVAREALKVPGARVHLHGKGSGRKVGHITVVAGSMQEASWRMQPLIACVDQIRAERRNNIPEPVTARGHSIGTATLATGSGHGGP
jgi:phosphoribosylaminoimidazole carboxylase